MNHCYGSKGHCTAGTTASTEACECLCEGCTLDSPQRQPIAEAVIEPPKTPIIQRFQLGLPEGVESGIVHYPTSDEMAEKMNEIIDWINRQ